jgi:hypothetical protein
MIPATPETRSQTTTATTTTSASRLATNSAMKKALNRLDGLTPGGGDQTALTARVYD